LVYYYSITEGTIKLSNKYL